MQGMIYDLNFFHKQLNQEFIENCLILSFKCFFSGRYQHLVEKYSDSCGQKTKDSICNKIFVDYCFTAMSYHGLVHYLIFR